MPALTADSSSSVQLPPGFIVQLTGPLLIGHLFNWGLYGCLVVQCYIYYLAFPKDTLLPKSLVGFALTLETLQTVLSTRDAFRNFGSGWGDFKDLDTVGWLWFSVPVIGSLISFTAQNFFAWRIWILSRQLYFPILIALISTTQCIFGLWVGISAHIVGFFSQFQNHSFNQTSVWLGGTALCDIIITFCMIYYLSRERNGFRSTNVLIARVIRVTVETGLICAAFAILDLSFFLKWRDNNYHLAPSIALSKLYSNSLLVVLNSRVRIVGGRVMTEPLDVTASVSFSTGTSAGNLQSRMSFRPGDEVLTTQNEYGPEEISLNDHNTDRALLTEVDYNRKEVGLV
ncbi:hypothetical protein BDQ17DRAFT_1355537 [Cyathus striatus]|nr:hypothetical protein BDQ17DRAFT_1355537 [Cyathus striatus]